MTQDLQTVKRNEYVIDIDDRLSKYRIILTTISICLPSMKYFLLPTVIISTLTFADNISVKTHLAELIESAVAITKININIPPNKVTEKSLEISSVNGLSVCSTESEKFVKALQNEFIKSDNIRLTYSIYGAYFKSNGKIKFLPPDTKSIKDLIGKCTNIYVSVY